MAWRLGCLGGWVTIHPTIHRDTPLHARPHAIAPIRARQSGPRHPHSTLSARSPGARESVLPRLVNRALPGRRTHPRKPSVSKMFRIAMEMDTALQRLRGFATSCLASCQRSVNSRLISKSRLCRPGVTSLAPRCAPASYKSTGLTTRAARAMSLPLSRRTRRPRGVATSGACASRHGCPQHSLSEMALFLLPDPMRRPRQMSWLPQEREMPEPAGRHMPLAIDLSEAMSKHEVDVELTVSVAPRRQRRLLSMNREGSYRRPPGCRV